MSTDAEERPAKRARESTAAGKQVPITLLSGFLGAGKTTLLKHLLENKQGLRIGVIVNDVAEVNIDASLVAVRTGSEAGGSCAQEDTVEMSNGCACCSAAEELLVSIEKLTTISDKRKLEWDHIVIETSGVAEPREVRDNLANCANHSPDLLRGTALHTMVTVIDSSTFLAEFQKRNKVEQRQDLGSSDFTDGNRQVVDLMCEQIECADVLITNKTDLTSADELTLLRETVASLNPHATIVPSERGRVELSKVLAAAGENGAAVLDDDSDLRRLVEQVNANEKAAASGKKESGHEHGHAEPSHEHGHVESNEHGHGGAACDKEGCAEDGSGGRSVSHEHDHAELAGGRPVGRHDSRFGITSFVYQRRRPFHPHRLMSVIRQLPVRQETLALAEALNSVGKDGKDGSAAGSAANGGSEGSPMLALIRSKGFVWLSNSHPQMFYWALAGKHFELKQYASWWQCVPRDEWPVEKADLATIQKDFDGEFGDHRQELVFIGVRMNKEAIVKLLDECLLSDGEMQSYRQHWLS